MLEHIEKVVEEGIKKTEKGLKFVVKASENPREAAQMILNACIHFVLGNGNMDRKEMQKTRENLLKKLKYYGFPKDTLQKVEKASSEEQAIELLFKMLRERAEITYPDVLSNQVGLINFVPGKNAGQQHVLNGAEVIPPCQFISAVEDLGGKTGIFRPHVKKTHCRLSKKPQWNQSIGEKEAAFCPHPCIPNPNSLQTSTASDATARPNM